MSRIVSCDFEEQLKKNEKLKESDIKHLREWNEQQRHLPKISDSSFVQFLHKNGYDLEATKVNIENYYTMRTHLPEFFSNRDGINCKELRDIFNVIYMFPLKLTDDGIQILFVKLLDPDADKYIFVLYVKYLLMVIDLWLYQNGIVDGYIIVFDVQDVTLKHASQVKPLNLKRYMDYLQKALPIHLIGIHFMNYTRGMQAILKISKNFMNQHLLSVLNVHPTIESFGKTLPIELLPNELGGKAGKLMELHEAQIKNLQDHQKWFLEEELLSKVDENKRLGKAKTVADVFDDAVSLQDLEVE